MIARAGQEQQRRGAPSAWSSIFVGGVFMAVGVGLVWGIGAALIAFGVVMVLAGIAESMQ